MEWLICFVKLHPETGAGLKYSKSRIIRLPVLPPLFLPYHQDDTYVFSVAESLSEKCRESFLVKGQLGAQ